VTRINWPRLGTAVGISFALVLIVIGFSTAQTGTAEDNFPEGLERVTPRRDAQVQRQSQVEVDLAPGYTGRLSLNGVQIPQDQYSFDVAQNILTYPCLPTDAAAQTDANGAPSAPAGAGWPACSLGLAPEDNPNLPTPAVTFTVRMWKIADGEGVGEKRYTWTFKTY
jgi:hypothetical protein